MTNDFAGFGFLQAAMHPVADIKREFGLGGTAAPDIKRGFGLGGAATPDMSAHASGVAMGSATTVDTMQHSTSTYLPLPQS